MKVPNFFSTTTTTISIFILTLISAAIPPSLTADDGLYVECGGDIICGGRNHTVTYPFWGENKPSYCGLSGFELHCGAEEELVIQISEQTLRVVNINTVNGTITIAQDSLWNGSCPQLLDFSQIKSENFRLVSNPESVTLYECDNGGKATFTCDASNGRETYCFAGVSGEKTIDILVSETVSSKFKSDDVNYFDLFKRGLDLRYYTNDLVCDPCKNSKGVCGSNSSNAFQCYCRDGAHHQMCDKHGRNILLKTILGVAGCAIGVLAACGFCYWYQRRKRKLYSASSKLLSQMTSSDRSSMASDIEKGGVFGVHVFTNDELEEVTGNFDPAKELGDGGFGTVYYGVLRDGREVAVKRLHESNWRRVEQFRNEVEILARLRHINLVSLYGSTSRSSRELLLVYEYISNGTLADHLHGPLRKSGSLPWPVRIKISIETAQALRYLHAADVIHRDVKTNNILLEGNFRVKVADFGLSRLFPTGRSHVSTAPQGTPGYLDPEYHQYYQLTEKSDVYSFGVVLIELISSLPAVDITRRRDEINLSSMAVRKIRAGAVEDLVDPELGFATDEEVRKGVTAVAELAFRCLQGEKETRPSMAEVLEDLVRIRGEDRQEGAPDAKTPDDRDSVGLLKSSGCGGGDGGCAVRRSPDTVFGALGSSSSSSSYRAPHTSK